MRRFFYYLGCTIAIGIIVYLGITYQIRLENEASETFNQTPVILFSFIFPIVIGILLGLPKLIIKFRRKSQWNFDWIKFSAIALPSLLILLMYVSLFYLPNSIQLSIPQGFFLGSPTFLMIAGVVFGYVLLDSLKKQ